MTESSGKSAAFKSLLWALRALAGAMVVLGVWLAYQRFHRTDEQVELSHYVEMEMPSFSAAEADVMRRLRPLVGPGGGLDAAAARKLLVDDVIPRLVAVRKRAVSIEARTGEVKKLSAEYVAWIDKLIEACRTSVRAIDDPAADPAASLAQVKRRFAEADAAAQAWAEHVREACVRHRLAPPAQSQAQPQPR